jgi:hypothetical protein
MMPPDPDGREEQSERRGSSEEQFVREFEKETRSAKGGQKHHQRQRSQHRHPLPRRGKQVQQNPFQDNDGGNFRLTTVKKEESGEEELLHLHPTGSFFCP